MNRSLNVCEAIHATQTPGVFYGKNLVDYPFTLMLLQIIFILSLTRTIRLLLKPLKQPRIVSDILGGMILGPSMLSANKSFLKNMYPPNTVHTLRNFSAVGFIYYLFLAGVKMDLTLARKANKKQLVMAVFGLLIPFAVSLSVAFSIRKYMPKELAKPQILGVITCVFSLASFPVIEQIIKELNLLSSEVGRLALSIAIITDVVGINGIVAFEAARHYNYTPIHALWVVLSAICIVGFIFCFRHALVWIVDMTPEGKQVHEGYVVLILVGALLSSFATDVAGLNLFIGPFWLGLVVPTGPPLGATLVDKTETIVDNFFMPFGFTFVGLRTDLTSLGGRWGNVYPLMVVAVTAYVAKIVAIFGLSRFYEMPVKDSLALALVNGMRGQVELLYYLHWASVRVITIPSFSMLVLLTLLIPAVSTPMLITLYDPTRPYMINKRRAIQFTAPNADLKIVACIHDQDSVAGFINLLEVSNPTSNTPFCIFALRMIELVGRAHPVFVDHENQVEAFELTRYNRVHSALTTFQESMGECVKCHPFTSVSPARTMYQDVCKLALIKKAAIIILPFKTESLDGATEAVHPGELHLLNANVLSHTPCSVGILVARSSGPTFRTRRQAGHRFAVLFLGGADAREALAYADRMAANPDVSLSVIRFLSYNGEGDDSMEKKLDDGLVTWFWVKNEGNERVVYREAVVSDGSETVLAIQAMMSDCIYDLWIVGRKSGINQVLIRGLSNWSKNDELGVIGDYIASVELAMNASVLVVQQQVLRQQEGGSDGLLGKLSNFVALGK